MKNEPIKIKISNNTHPMELQVVFAMLEKQGLRPVNETETSITCIVPTEGWFNSIKQAVEFMSECGVEKI